MFSAEPCHLAWLDRPSSGAMIVAAVFVTVGWVLHVWAEWATRTPISVGGEDQRPGPLALGSYEPPAVVALLTNGYSVPPSAITATALDLAARGWIRLATADGELIVVTRGNGVDGDHLRPFEQRVLNHLGARAFNDITSAATLAGAQRRLNRRWMLRFSHSVAATSRKLGLSRRRYRWLEITPAAIATVVAAAAAWSSIRNGTEVAVADSWRSRTIWFVVAGAVVLLAMNTVGRAIGAAQRGTDLGRDRSAAWLGHRARLRSRIPPNASVRAAPEQQTALAHAVVMGVAPQVLDELPVAPPDPRHAWSEAGDLPHVVRVRYPLRPGYGQHPLRVGLTGAVLLVASRWLQGFFERVAEGDALESLMERIPGQVDLIERVAEILAVVCWAPIVWSVWAIIAGSVDTFATRSRSGAVVRTPRAADVIHPLVLGIVRPFAERDRFTTYLALDDGRRKTVTAWLATERTAAPQGAQAQVRATPLLGYVRSSEPVGTATRR